MISGFDYLLRLQLNGCKGEVTLPPLEEQAIQPQPSNSAKIVGGAMWRTAIPANAQLFDKQMIGTLCQ